MHLKALPKRRPVRKSAQIRWLWLEIREALAAGHTINDLWEELARDGLAISYSKLRTYVARLRKADQQRAVDSGPDPRIVTSPGTWTEVPSGGQPPKRGNRGVEPTGYDPLANLRERLTRRPGFNYDDRPPDEKKLI
jgi:hypothetical protein